MITVLIVDDHPVVREGLKLMLEVRDGMNVVGVAATAQEAVDFCRSNGTPDVIVSDIRMPGGDGFELLQKLKRFFPDVRVLFVAGLPLREELTKAREMGASGYLPKTLEGLKLAKFIRHVAQDANFFACEEELPEKDNTLTPKEQEVLSYIAIGKTHPEIGIIMGISAGTVKTHMKNIAAKLNVSNAPAAINRAYEPGILRA